MSSTSFEAAPAAHAEPDCDVFLSHNGRDKPAVERIATHLRSLGLTPWLDDERLGDEFLAPMHEAVARAGACAVFIGPHGLGKWQLREAEVAYACHVEDPAYRVIPVLLPGLTDDGLAAQPQYLRLFRYVDFRAGLNDPDALQALRRRILGIGGQDTPDEVDEADDGACPYRGLEAFDAEHARFFYGREADVERLLAKLRAGRFLAVLGASGSGKSSVVLAGLVPRLLGGALPGSQTWTIQVLRPGGDPLKALADAATLRSGHQAVHRTLDDLASDPRTLDSVGGLILAQQPRAERVVWVIDQAEEMFTQCHDEAKRRQFLANLVYAASVEGGRTVVLLTMRADFYANCAPYADFSRLLESNQYLVGPLGEAELRRAIEEPAGGLGRTFEKGLVDTILDDVRQQPGSLPLLQYALRELWQRQEGHMLTLKGYTETGGVAGALAKRADATFEQLDEAERQIARFTLLQLTQPHAGMEATRRRVTLRQLVPSEASRPAVVKVVQELVAARLLTTDRQGNDEWVDVAHEALIRNWDRLREWVEEDSEGVRLHHKLEDAAQEWKQGGQSEEELWVGTRLAQLLEWRDQHERMLSEDARAFLEASVARREREEREREERHARELRDAQQIALAQARLLKLRGGLLVVLIVGVVVASYFAVSMFSAQRTAEQQRQVAFAGQLAGQAIENLDQIDLALLLSLEGNRHGDTPEVRRSLLATLAQSPRLTRFLHGHTGGVESVATDPQDANVVASASDDGTLRLWDLSTGQARGAPLTGHAGVVWSVAFSPDGATLASAGNDGTVRLWDVATGQPRGEPLADGTGPVRSVAFSPDGQSLAFGGEDHLVHVWDLAAGQPRLPALAGHKDAVHSLAFSPDGRRLASGSDDNTIRLWDPASGQSVGEPLGGLRMNPGNGWVVSLAFQPGGQVLAAGIWNGTVETWDLGRGQPLRPPALVGSTPVASVAFSPDGATLAVGSVDKSISLFDVATGERRDRLTGHGHWVNSLAYTPDGRLVSGGGDGNVGVWDGPPIQPVGRAMAGAPPVPIASLRFRPDGQTLTAASFDTSSVVWDFARRQVRTHPSTPRPISFARTMAISPDAQRLVWATMEDVVLVTDAATDEVIVRLPTVPEHHAASLAFSDDGRVLASGGCSEVEGTTCTQGDIVVWSTDTWQPRGEPLLGHTDSVWQVALSPDGHRLASVAGEREVRVWDLEAAQPSAQTVELGGVARVKGLAFSPDGATVATALQDGTAVLFDARTGQALGDPLPVAVDPPEEPSSVAFGPGGLLAVGTQRGAVHVWDVGARQQRLEPLHISANPQLQRGILSLAFLANGRALAAGDWLGDVNAWDLSSGRAVFEPPLAALTGGTNTLVFSPDGRRVHSGGTGSAITSWDVATGNRAGLYPLDGVVNVDALAISGAGQTLAINSSLTRTTGILDYAGSRPPIWQSAPAQTATVSPDGTLVAVGTCVEFTPTACTRGEVQLWDASDGHLVRSLPGHTNVARSLVFSRDGTRIAAGSEDGSIMVWDVATGNALAGPLTGHTAQVYSLAFSADGKTLASGSRDTKIMLWDVETGTRTLTLTDHTNTVLSLAYSSDGALLASASADTSVRLWDVAHDYLPLGALQGHTGWVMSVAFSPTDRYTLASGAWDHTVMVWNLDPAVLRGHACAVANRNLSRDEWRRYLGDEPYSETCPGLPDGPAAQEPGRAP